METGPVFIGMTRHGHSAAQEMRDRAEKAGELTFSFEPADPLAPLTERGREETRRLGEWLAEQKLIPSAVIASPYLRTVETAELIVSSMRLCAPVLLEDALVEIGWGEFDGLTKAGRKLRYPEHFERRRQDKFHTGAPGGESWSEVIGRVRPVVEKVQQMDGFVLIVGHEVIVKCLRHIIEGLSPEQTLALRGVPNASLTLYRRVKGGFRLQLENYLPWV